MPSFKFLLKVVPVFLLNVVLVLVFTPITTIIIVGLIVQTTTTITTMKKNITYNNISSYTQNSRSNTEALSLSNLKTDILSS